MGSTMTSNSPLRSKSAACEPARYASFRFLTELRESRHETL